MSQDKIGGSNVPTQGYASTEELTADMSDVRYTGNISTPPDPAFIAHVRARLAAAPSAPAAPPAGSDPLETAEDVVAAMRDKRYGTDEQYTAEVRARLKNVDLGVRTSSRSHIMFDGKGGWVDVEQERYAAEARRQAAAVSAVQPVNVPGIGPVSPFASQHEMVAAMSTSEYKRGDAVAHAIVRARLSVTNF